MQQVLLDLQVQLGQRGQLVLSVQLVLQVLQVPLALEQMQSQ